LDATGTRAEVERVVDVAESGVEEDSETVEDDKEGSGDVVDAVVDEPCPQAPRRFFTGACEVDWAITTVVTVSTTVVE
jgi:hypothetical protein